jgi:hypothetical protein
VWSNQQAGTAVIVVSSASTVSVVGTDINGCPAASDPLVFIETTPAAISISPASPITICSDPATLTASQGFVTYAWSDGEVGMSNSVNSPGSYSVTATDAQGCIVTSSPVIVQNGSSVDIPVSPSISAICDNVPEFYQQSLTDIELDEVGRVLLPMQLKDKKYKILFDNGSSLFPLLVTDDKTNNFSTLPASDTIKGYAWGNAFTFIGRPLNDSFVITNQTFYKTTVYADYRKDYRTNKYDAITGNILFWDKTIIIDLKNKKFGVQ